MVFFFASRRRRFFFSIINIRNAKSKVSFKLLRSARVTQEIPKVNAVCREGRLKTDVIPYYTAAASERRDNMYILDVRLCLNAQNGSTATRRARTVVKSISSEK